MYLMLFNTQGHSNVQRYFGTYADSKGPGQTAHLRSLARAFAVPQIYHGKVTITVTDIPRHRVGVNDVQRHYKNSASSKAELTNDKTKQNRNISLEQSTTQQLGWGGLNLILLMPKYHFWVGTLHPKRRQTKS